MIEFVLEVQLPLSHSRRMLGAPLRGMMRWLRRKVIPERIVNPWHGALTPGERIWLRANGFIEKAEVLRIQNRVQAFYPYRNLTRFRLPGEKNFWYHRSELGHLPIKGPGERIRHHHIRPPQVTLHIPIAPLIEADLAHVTEETLADYRRRRVARYWRERRAEARRQRVEAGRAKSA